MQKITVKEVSPSTGDNKPTIIVTEDGSKMSGFDTGLKGINPGDILEVEVEVKKGYTNITSFKLLQKGAAPLPNGGSGGTRSSMSPEDWAKKDRLERFSIEAQTAYKGIIELAKTPPTEWRHNKVQVEERFAEVFKEALEWASAHFKVSAPEAKPATAAKKAEAKSPEAVTEEGFKNVGEFFAACQAKGIPRSKALEIIKVSEEDVSKINTVDAWSVIQEYIVKEDKALWG